MIKLTGLNKEEVEAISKQIADTDRIFLINTGK